MLFREITAAVTGDDGGVGRADPASRRDFDRLPCFGRRGAHRLGAREVDRDVARAVGRAFNPDRARRR